MANSPCCQCGACCATFRITLPRIELASRGGRVPDHLTQPYTATTACLREDPETPGRCIALEGTLGISVNCSIYPNRPAACEEFAPLATINEGDDACDEARRRHGLPPLRRL